MNLEKLQNAKNNFENYQKQGASTDYLWFVMENVFDALVEPPMGDGSIDRATDGRITEEPVAVLPQKFWLMAVTRIPRMTGRK